MADMRDGPFGNPMPPGMEPQRQGDFGPQAVNQENAQHFTGPQANPISNEQLMAQIGPGGTAGGPTGTLLQRIQGLIGGLGDLGTIHIRSGNPHDEALFEKLKLIASHPGQWIVQSPQPEAKQPKGATGVPKAGEIGDFWTYVNVNTGQTVEIPKGNVEGPGGSYQPAIFGGGSASNQNLTNQVSNKTSKSGNVSGSNKAALSVTGGQNNTGSVNQSGSASSGNVVNGQVTKIVK